MNRHWRWIVLGSIVVGMAGMLRPGKADDLRTVRLGDVATIALPGSFIEDEGTATFWPLDRIGNEELRRLGEARSRFDFSFKSDPHSTLGGKDYRIWLSLSFFETAAALDADVAACCAAAAPRSDPTGDGTRFLAEAGSDTHTAMRWIDAGRLVQLRLTWRRDRYSPGQAQQFLHDAAAAMAIDQGKVAAHFRGVHEFLASRSAAEARNLGALNAYLRGQGLPALGMGSAAAVAGISYAAYRGRDDIAYLIAAKYAGEIDEAALRGVDQEGLLRAGFQSDRSFMRLIDDAPPGASSAFMSGLAKHPTAKPPFPVYFYATASANLTLQTLDPQRLFDRLGAARLPSPLPRR